MNCKNLDLRELQVLKHIGRNKRKNILVKKLTKLFDESVLSTVIKLNQKHLINYDDNKESVSITVGGTETLKDYRLHRRNIWIGYLINAAIATVSTLFGVVVGYLLSFI